MPKSPNDTEMWEEAAQRLVKLSVERQIEWKPTVKIDCTYGNGARPRPPGYVAEVSGKRIAVYEYEYRYYTDADEWHLETDIAIEFVDAQNRLEWTWPAPRSRHELWDVIKFQKSGANDFLEQFLGKSMVE